VGHSYGGAVIGAAGLAATNVRALVYVNAFVPPAFATGLSAELQTEFYAKQRPITFAAVGAPAAPGQAWEELPSWYVAGRVDGSIPLDLQLRMAERAGAAVTEVQAGHLSMVDHPREVADVIKAAARGTAQ